MNGVWDPGTQAARPYPNSWQVTPPPFSVPWNRFNHTSLIVVATATDRLKSVRNRCIIEAFGGIFVLSLGFFLFSDGIRAIVITLSLSFSLFYLFVTMNFLHKPNDGKTLEGINLGVQLLNCDVMKSSHGHWIMSMINLRTIIKIDYPFNRW